MNFLIVSVTVRRDFSDLEDSLKLVKAVLERVINITVIFFSLNNFLELISENFKN